MLQSSHMLSQLAKFTSRVTGLGIFCALSATSWAQSGMPQEDLSALEWAGEKWTFHSGSWESEGHSPADATLTWAKVDGPDEKDAILTCSGEPNGFLINQKEYTDYELSLQWRWTGEEGGNSGLLISTIPSQAGFRLWPLSLEVQLAHGKAGDFYFLGKNVGGTLKGNIVKVHTGIPVVYARRLQTKNGEAGQLENPLGEWNQMRLTVKNQMVEVFVNDHKVNYLQDLKPARGKIALQSEGAPIEFRALKIEEIE